MQKIVTKGIKKATCKAENLNVKTLLEQDKFYFKSPLKRKIFYRQSPPTCQV